MSDARSKFREAIIDYGLEPPTLIERGRIHRFPGKGKGPGNRAGWCLFFEDGQGGCFGDWSAGFTSTWLNTSWKDARTKRGRRALMHQIAAAKTRLAAVQAQEHEKAAERALTIWNAADPAPSDYPYLADKMIRPTFVRWYEGVLVLPVVNLDGQLASLQTIDLAGNKRLLVGGRKKGCVIPVSMPCANHPRGEPMRAVNCAYCAYSAYRRIEEKDSRLGNCAYSANCAFGNPRVFICEGWATGCTLAEDNPESVTLAAIDAGNLKAVALGVRRRSPNATIIIAGDDDRLTPGNPGATKAHEAAIAADARVKLPIWPEDAPLTLTDFNDLHQWLWR